MVSHEHLAVWLLFGCLVNLVKALKPQVALHDALDACKVRIAESTSNMYTVFAL